VNGVVDEHALVVGVAEVVAVERLPKVTQRPVAHRAQRLIRLQKTQRQWRRVRQSRQNDGAAAEENDINKGVGRKVLSGEAT
jgi:hypothetical protein